MKYKKILLGSLAIGITTLVPIATIISCGSNTTKPKNIKVVVPTKATGKVSGVNGKGIYSTPTLTGTKVTADKTTGLSTGNTVKVTYTLLDGYIWNNKTTAAITLNFKVPKLNIGVVKPTATTTAVTMEGYNGNGTLYPKELTGTIIATSKSEGLSNGDEVTLTYTLKTGYAWTDGSTKPAISTYKVAGLNNGLDLPTTKNAKVTFTGTTGQGTFKMPTYANTTPHYGNPIPTNLKNGDTIKIEFQAKWRLCLQELWRISRCYLHSFWTS